MNISIYFILAVIFILSFLLSPFTIWYSKKLSMMDIANHRSSHEGITPRGGGIIFIIIFYSEILVYSLFEAGFDLALLIILLCALFMGFIGWLDDFKNLSVKTRLGIQFLVVLLSCMFLPQIWPAIPVIVEKTVIILAWMWFINLFNFMDGTDGYAAQEAVFICIGLFILNSSIGIIALILAFSVLGFLRVNYPKAKIFMGSVGSIFLGYILGGLLIYSIAIHSVTIVQAVILTSLFSVDATYTLLKRGLQRKKVWKAHREHWYQRLNITGINHKVIFYIGIAYNLIVVLLLIFNKINYINDFILLVVPLFLLLSIAFYVTKEEIKILEKTKEHDKIIS